MNSKKLWTAFCLILGYLCFTALISVGGARLFVFLGWKWGLPFAFGGVFWVLSLVLFLCREKAFLFSPLALLSNAVGAGLFITSFIVGKKIPVSWSTLFTTSVFLTMTYLILMLFLTVPTLKRKIWYVVIAFLLSITASILLCNNILLTHGTKASYSPAYYDPIILFFLLLYAMLALGSILPAEDFEELLTAITIPALISTFFLAIIVLLCLAGDGCDCDCGDGCCDCGDCSGGEYNSTTYGKKRKTSMSQISSPSTKWT